MIMRLPSLLSLLLLCAACSKPAEPSADAPKDKPADAPTAAKPADLPAEKPQETPADKPTEVPKKAEKPTPEQVRAAVQARKKHIARGRKLSKEKKFEEALAAFEEAVKLDPYDASALSELGWVAFQANKLERAEEATRASLRFTYDPKVRGATLYNMGRIHEARQELDKAAAAYAESLAVRDNATVAKRLEDLRQRGVTTSEDEPQDCGFKRHNGDSPEAICKAIASSKESLTCSDSEIKTWKLAHPRITEAALVGVDEPREFTTHYHLLVKVDGVWYSDVLGYAYNPGAFGVSEEFKVETLELRPLLPGGALALYIEAVHSHLDSDMGINEVSYQDRATTHVVGLRDGAVDWLFGALTLSSWERDILTEEGEEEMKDAGMEHDTKLPVGESRTAQVSFKNGKVTISAAPGEQLPERLTAGTFELLGDAPRCASYW